MMIDGGVTILAVIIVAIIAFLKGLYYERKEDRDNNPFSKYSERDIHRFEEFIKDVQKSKNKKD